MNFSVRFSTSNSLRRQAFVSGAPNPPVISRSGPPGEQEMAITSAPGSTKQVSHSVTPSLLGGSRSASSPREVVVVPNSLQEYLPICIISAQYNRNQGDMQIVCALDRLPWEV